MLTPRCKLVLGHSQAPSSKLRLKGQSSSTPAATKGLFEGTAPWKHTPASFLLMNDQELFSQCHPHGREQLRNVSVVYKPWKQLSKIIQTP